MTDKHLYLSFSTDFKGTLKLTSSFDLNEVNYSSAHWKERKQRLWDEDLSQKRTIW